MEAIEYEKLVQSKIETLKFFPPNLLAEVVIESLEARDGENAGNENYSATIEAAFEVERTNNGFCELLDAVIELKMTRS